MHDLPSSTACFRNPPSTTAIAIKFIVTRHQLINGRVRPLVGKAPRFTPILMAKTGFHPDRNALGDQPPKTRSSAMARPISMMRRVSQKRFCGNQQQANQTKLFADRPARSRYALQAASAAFSRSWPPKLTSANGDQRIAGAGSFAQRMLFIPGVKVGKNAFAAPFRWQ